MVKSLFDNIVIAFFCLAISIPAFIMLATPPQLDSDIERRTLTSEIELQSTNFSAFLSNLERYITDQLGLREEMIQFYNLINLRLLSNSTVDDVLVGKDDWLFYTTGLDSYRGISQFSNADLENWLLHLEARRDMAAEYGAEYLLIIAPDKHTIYPEYLPDSVTKTSDSTRLDQLIAYLDQRSDIHVLDLRDPLLEAKKTQTIYFKYDTHWNQYGAYIAYQEITNYLKNLFPSSNIPQADNKISQIIDRPGDLMGMLGLDELFFERDVTTYSLVTYCASLAPFVPGNEFDTACDQGEISAIVIGDSFFSDVVSYLAQSLARGKFVRMTYDHEYMRSRLSTFHPDIVIEEFVERNFDIISNTFWIGK